MRLDGYVHIVGVMRCCICFGHITGYRCSLLEGVFCCLGFYRKMYSGEQMYCMKMNKKNSKLCPDIAKLYTYERVHVHGISIFSCTVFDIER